MSSSSSSSYASRAARGYPASAASAAAAAMGDEVDEVDIDEYLAPTPGEFGAGAGAGAAAGSHYNQDVLDLTRHWKNEKAAPDVLPFATEVVRRLEERVRDQASKILDGEGRAWSQQVQSWHQLDCDRIRYLLNSYKRMRLFKVQRWFLHLHASPAARRALSPNEAAFLDRYHALRLKHLTTSVLDNLPPHMRGLGGEADVGGGSGASSYDRDGGGASSSSSSSLSGGGSAEGRLREGPALTKHVLVRARASFRLEEGSAGVSVRRLMEGEPADEEGVMQVGNLQILPYVIVRSFLVDGSMEAM